MTDGAWCDLLNERDNTRTGRARLTRVSDHFLKATVWVEAGLYCGGNVYTANGTTLAYVIAFPIHMFSPGQIQITFVEDDPGMSAELRKALFTLAA